MRTMCLLGYVHSGIMCTILQLQVTRCGAITGIRTARAWHTRLHCWWLTRGFQPAVARTVFSYRTRLACVGTIGWLRCCTERI